MEYNCSLNNSYEIIELCDIKEYNKQINRFLDNSWEQLILSEKLIIPNNKLSIQDISKVYLNIKVDKPKIINVPYSDKKNIEGLSSTGKVLLVFGEIHQVVIYISKSINNTLKSAKFNVSFTKYITLDENAILQNDLYCIYPYIENISLRILDERTVINNITLFLFAHNITRTPFLPVIEKFLTFLTLKSSDTDEEIAKVEFDKTNMMLIVTSTEVIFSSISDAIAFEVKLLDSNGNVKNFGVIKSNENADAFKDTLNLKNFKFGDFIEVHYLNPSKITLNNFPNLNDFYRMSTSKKSEKFLITPNGITPILTPNKIIIKSKKNEEVLSIQFAKEREVFIVSSTGEVPDPFSSDIYLNLILKDINGNDIFIALNSNENGTSFKSILNGKSFQYNKDTLILIYKNPSKVEILNFPTQGNLYRPTQDINVFIIQPNNIRNLTFNNSIKILNESNKQMSNLYFIPSIYTSTIKILSISNNLISTITGNLNEKYIQFLQYSKTSPIFYGEIFKKETAINFSNKLDKNIINLSFRNFLRLSNRLRHKIIITNFKNQNEYNIGEEAEFLSITESSLLPNPLSYNKLRFKNKDNSTVLYIYFHKIDNNIIYIEPYSTGILNKDSTSFSFTIKNPIDKSIILTHKIHKGENGDLININPPFNISKNFQIGFLFIIEYSNNSLIEIFDFPFSNPPYNPSLNSTSETFIITENGLKKIEPPVPPIPPSILKFPNTIILNDVNNLPVLTIKCNLLTKRFIINSSERVANPIGTEDYFSISLLESDGITEKQISWVSGNQTSKSFKNVFNNLNFEFEDILKLQYEERNKVILTSYSNERNLPYTPLGNEVSFKITQKGLVEILPLKPIIKFKNAFIFKTLYKDEEMARIEFDISNLRLIVTSTGISYNTQKIPMFKFELLTLEGYIQTYEYIYGNTTAYNLKHILDNYYFNYNQIINLTFDNVSKIFLTNYPNLHDNYFMLSRNKQSFKITRTGIIPNVLQNTIILNDISNLPVLTIEFDALNKQFLINSTKKIANEIGTIHYFTMSLFESDGITLKKVSNIIGGNNGLFFKQTFNSIDFKYGDILKLQYEENSKIIITNYPNKGDDPYNPLGNEQKFRITQNGLKPI